MGGTTGRMINPFSSKKADKSWGVGVSKPNIGEGVVAETSAGRCRMCAEVWERTLSSETCRYFVNARSSARRC